MNTKLNIDAIEDHSIPIAKLQESIFDIANAMVYKGSINANSDLPAIHKLGWTYRVNTAGEYVGVNCEVGDLIICIIEGTSQDDTHWSVGQTNIDGAVIGPTSSTSGNVAIFDGETGKFIKDSGKQLTPESIGALSLSGGELTGDLTAPNFIGDLQGNANFATDLTGRNEATIEEFTLRPSAGNKSIRDDSATIKRIKGNSIVWNQMISTPPVMPYTNRCNLSISGNDINATVNSIEYDFVGFYYSLPDNSHPKTVNGHTYFISGLFSCPKQATIAFGVGSSSIKQLVPANTLYSYNTIQKQTSDTVGAIFTCWIEDMQVEDTFKVQNWNVIDLTQMFGAGNEPDTVEEFRALFPGNHYEHNPGQLVSMTADGLFTNGFNQWDEQWESGVYKYWSDGQKVDNSEYIRSVNFIRVIPTKTYCLNIKAGVDSPVCFYDENNNFLGQASYSYKNNYRLFQVPANCQKIAFYTKATTYNNDICINLSHTGVENGKYEPYWDATKDLSIIQKYFPNGMRSAGSIYDEISFDETTQKWVAIQRVGNVDLGSLSWFASTATPTDNVINRFFYAQINGLQLGYGTIMISAPYDEIDVHPNSIRSKDKTIYCSDNYVGGNSPTAVIIRDSSYNDTASFKTAMSGIMLNYELAEPIITVIEEPINLSYKVGDFGVEQILSDSFSAPFRADIIYQFNATDRIRENSLNIEKLSKTQKDYLPLTGTARNSSKLGDYDSSLYFKGTNILESDDFNSKTSIGLYRYNGITGKNGPTDADPYGNLMVLRSGTHDTLAQLYFNYLHNRVFVRNGSVSGIIDNDWSKIAFTSDIPTSLKNPNKLTLKVGNNTPIEYDGSSAKTVNIDFAHKQEFTIEANKYAKITGRGIFTAFISVGSTLGNARHMSCWSSYGSGQSMRTNIKHIINGTDIYIDESDTGAIIYIKGYSQQTVIHILCSLSLFTCEELSSLPANVSITNTNSNNYTLAVKSDIPTTLKNPYSLTIQGNGTSLGTYDGSSAKTVNITPSDIGALALPGGTMSGQINSQDIKPVKDNTYQLGDSTHKYKNVFSDFFTGNLDGNAKTASDLTGRIEATPEVFTYRPSAGEKSIKDNNAFIRRVRGNSVVFNQQLKTLFSPSVTADTVTSNGITFTRLSSGGYNISGSNNTSDSAMSNNTTANLELKAGHKYIIIPIGLKKSAISFYGPASGVSSFITTDARIITPTNSASVLLRSIVKAGVTDVNETIYCNVHDLTQMFGAGNEPATVEEFRALYPDSYYPYNTGELRNLVCSGIKTVGFNQWDEQWEYGYFTQEGKDATNTTHIKCKNYIPVISGAIYYAKLPEYVTDFNLWAYDENFNYLATIHPWKNTTFTIPQNAKYCRFYVNTGGNPYNNNICINLHHTGWRDGDYEPYKEVTHSLPLSQITNGEPLRKAGSVYDEINETEYIRRVGVVDLGSYDWYETPNGTFSISSVVSIPDIKAVELESNYTCKKYIGVSDPSKIFTGTADNLTISTNGKGRIYIRDDAYKTGTAYAAVPALKASLSGVLLHYELAEPIVTPIDTPIDFNYYVEDFGTEEALLAEDSAPFSADIVYQFNATDQIRNNTRNIDKLQKSAFTPSGTSAQYIRGDGSYGNVLEFTQAIPINDGEYEMPDAIHQFILTPNYYAKSPVELDNTTTVTVYVTPPEDSNYLAEYWFEFKTGEVLPDITFTSSTEDTKFRIAGDMLGDAVNILHLISSDGGMTFFGEMKHYIL